MQNLERILTLATMQARNKGLTQELSQVKESKSPNLQIKPQKQKSI